MGMKINKADVVEHLKESGKFIGNLSLKIYRENLNQVGEQASSEAIELGSENTLLLYTMQRLTIKKYCVL